MKIIAYDACRMSVLFPVEEVAPVGGAPLDAIVASVAARYQFAKLPDLNASKTELDKSGIKFERGVLEGTAINISDFTVFSDGIVVTAQTTEDAEVFWLDVWAWLRQGHGFRDFSTPPELRFVSQIIVEFERPLSAFISHFTNISSKVSNILGSIYDCPVPVGFARIDLAFDKVGSKSSLNVPPFIIERRVSIPFDRERYMCGAPMRTRDHISVLEDIERLLV
jgi:hypothetical protein